MFRKILLCIDESPSSEQLVKCLCQMKILGIEEIILAHVIYVANTPGLEVLLEDAVRPFIERQKSSLESHDYRITVEMPLGLPAQTLADTAEKHDVSLIVIGAHGYGVFLEAIMGSVSSKLLHLTRRPVLLMQYRFLETVQIDSACNNLFSNILFPSDFSETAEHALEYVGHIAAEMKSPVTLLHVYEDKHLDAESRQRLEDGRRFFADAKVERLKSRGVSEARVELTFGDPAQVIIDQANKGVFSLVIMGSQGKGLVQEVFLGSVSSKVVRHASSPVLLIPAKK